MRRELEPERLVTALRWKMSGHSKHQTKPHVTWRRSNSDRCAVQESKEMPTLVKWCVIRGITGLGFALIMLIPWFGPPALAQSVTSTVAVGTTPEGVAVNATTNRVFVANTGGNNVSVIDGTANAVVATISLVAGSGPNGVAVNPTTNRVYVA